MSTFNWWGDWRPTLTPHTGNLQPTDLIECTSIVGGATVNTAITGAQIIAAASSGSATWGGITGTLSAQTDLQTALNGKEPSITAGTTSQYYRGDKTFQTLDKSAVGLGNVDNTSDANKPVSTATQTALDAKQNKIILFCSSAVTSVTGTTTETLIASVPIPTTISNAMLRSSFTVRVTTLGGSNPRSRMRIGTFASPTTAQLTASTQIATNAIGSAGMMSIYRTMPVIGGVSGNIKAFEPSSNANADYGQLAAFTVTSRDFTTQQYLYFTIQNTSLTTVTESYGVLVENIQ